jgi:hypothetical protein
MGENEMSRIADLVADLIGAFVTANGGGNDARLAKMRSHSASQVAQLRAEVPSSVREQRRAYARAPPL